MKQFLLTSVLCSILSLPSQAADHEISFELGTFANNDETYNLFGGNDGMKSWGFRGGYAIHDRVSIIASYHHHRTGSHITTDEDWEYAFHSAYYANLFGIGAKADVQPLKWLQFYSALQGLAYLGTARFDADGNSRTNIGQFNATSLAVGGQVTVGTEIKIRLKTNKSLFKKSEAKDQGTLQFAWHIEGGYGIVSKHEYQFKDVNAEVNGFPEESENNASMNPGGFVLRSGLGMRF